MWLRVSQFFVSVFTKHLLCDRQWQLEAKGLEGQKLGTLPEELQPRRKKGEDSG